MRGAKRLVVGFSEKRAAKDASNREKGIAKLRKRFASGTITKSKITQRGYNKFLKVSGTGRMEVAIDEALVAEEARWDGLKGYVTNAVLSDSEVVEAYHELYNVEQSFRIAKSKLEIRPMFHFNAQRIADTGARLHLLRCAEGVPRAGSPAQAQQAEHERGYRSEYRQDHPHHPCGNGRKFANKNPFSHRQALPAHTAIRRQILGVAKQY